MTDHAQVYILLLKVPTFLTKLRNKNAIEYICGFTFWIFRGNEKAELGKY